jgi:tryptophanyl-tRNA synthetase
MAQVYSGIQPSGELHIGNYLGAVKNWVALQRSHPGAIFCVVTYHALTGAYDPEALRRRSHEMALSLLAAGVDPNAASLYLQSDVPEHTELAWIFNTITPLGELERQTQYKDKVARQESVAVGVLTYPVLQAADILLYHGDAIPVGEDQVQHLELSREIARKWNARFAPEDRPYFPEPQPLLTPTRRIMGSTAGQDVEVAGQHGRACSSRRRACGRSCGRRSRTRRACARPTRDARGVQHLPPPPGVQREPWWPRWPSGAARRGGGASSASGYCTRRWRRSSCRSAGGRRRCGPEPGQVGTCWRPGAERCRRSRARRWARCRGAMGLG